ncbi:molybdopterin cofactor-binding domain-containing protein [Hyphomicrobium sp.]|jgi:isoquinoline 1-oxidoreductase beta subunit|uniref:xanthine dehydrogenase family protein molybdopterin-binding subunit n=1 Tax=Hyphomicrobium sp. TaxID=82 RepID=UPI00356361A8
MSTNASLEARGLSRRDLLKAGAAGFLLVSFRLPVARAAGDTFAPNAFIRIGDDDVVTLVMPQVEMGQGIYTTVGMILADELDADFNKVVLQHAPPDKAYNNPLFGIQATGGSTSVRAFWDPLRKAGAAGRAMLVEAAAQQWSVEPSTCRTSNSEVIHDASGRKVGYGALAALAATMKPVGEPKLKLAKDYTLIGKPVKRKDTLDKTDGRSKYGIDAMPTGVKFAAIAQCPIFGGKVGHVDDTKAKAIKGFQQVVADDDFVAVVADTTWSAMQALTALDIKWDEGPNANVNSAQVWDALRAASKGTGAVAKQAGDVDKALADGTRYDGVYELPFLAHATMEPLNCTVHYTKDACEVWTGTQVIARVQEAVAKAVGLPIEKVTVHNFYLGGGFGRRLDHDMTIRAARVALHVDGPVKVTWGREEDMQHDVYRPVYHNAVSATLKDGKIVGWSHRITGSSIMARWFPAGFKDGVDGDAVDGAIDQPYGFPNLKVEYIRAEPPAVPTGFWRGVGPNNNIFAIESFIDDIAHREKVDPVAFRLRHLDNNPRLKAAIHLATEKGNWGAPTSARVGRGISVQNAWNTFVATVCEAEVDENGEVRVHRLVTAIDAGIPVNPDTIAAQIEGALIFGLTAALFGEVTIENGRVQQSNFNDYRMLRINEAPKIEVHVIPSTEHPGGVGEPGTASGPPALANALFAATGVRLTRLPIDREALAGRKPV